MATTATKPDIATFAGPGTKPVMQTVPWPNVPDNAALIKSWAFTGNDLPLGVDMLYRTRAKYPWLEMQTIYPLTEDGIGRAVADAMAMKTVKSTIVPFPEMVE